MRRRRRATGRPSRIRRRGSEARQLKLLRLLGQAAPWPTPPRASNLCLAFSFSSLCIAADVGEEKISKLLISKAPTRPDQYTNKKMKSLFLSSWSAAASAATLVCCFSASALVEAFSPSGAGCVHRQQQQQHRNRQPLRLHAVRKIQSEWKMMPDEPEPEVRAVLYSLFTSCVSQINIRQTRPLFRFRSAFSPLDVNPTPFSCSGLLDCFPIFDAYYYWVRSFPFVAFTTTPL